VIIPPAGVVVVEDDVPGVVVVLGAAIAPTLGTKSNAIVTETTARNRANSDLTDEPSDPG